MPTQTTPNMSYINPGVPAGLYEMNQTKNIQTEQVLYLSGQLPSGLPVHPQYMPQMQIPRPTQGQVSLMQYIFLLREADNILIL